MDERRLIQLIRILDQNQEPVSSSSICKELDITSRTLRNDLRESKKEFFDNGFEIQSIHAVGYRLNIIDENKYYQYITDKLRENSENQMLVPVYPEERVNYLIRMFLSAKDYLKMDDICDQLFISRSTLTNDLKDVREKIEFFHLELESKPAYGLKIVGSEMHKRSCIAQYFYHTGGYDDRFLSNTGNVHRQKEISEILYKVMQEEQYRLTDVGFQNLVIHLVITLNRLQQNPNPSPYKYEINIKDTKEYKVAKIICERLYDRFGISFPEQEIYYVAIHLSGKKAIQYHGVTEEYQGLLDKVLKQINEKYKMDFSFDMDLRTTLSLHIIPMMNRLKYDMIIQNPLLASIKEEQSIAFEMGVLLAEETKKEYGYDMSEAEIGYIALHFALAIERYKSKGAKKNVIIICASGLGSSQILLYKIQNQFKEYIGSIYTTQLYELPYVNQSEYDFILSTVPIPFETEIPAIHVQYFLNDNDISKINDFLKETITNENIDFADRFFKEEEFYTDLKGKTKEDILHEMCNRLSKTRDLPSDFETEILKRERFASTEFGNSLAIPHPMIPVTDESFVAVAVLNKPVRWGKEKVRFVFLLSVSKNEEKTFGLLHETLSALVFDKKALDRLEKKPCKETLKKILTELAEEENGNDLNSLFG